MSEQRTTASNTLNRVIQPVDTTNVVLGRDLIALHNLKARLDAQGAWGMAEDVQKLILEIILKKAS